MTRSLTRYGKIQWRATTRTLQVDDESAKRPDDNVEEEVAAGIGGVRHCRGGGVRSGWWWIRRCAVSGESAELRRVRRYPGLWYLAVAVWREVLVPAAVLLRLPGFHHESWNYLLTGDDGFCAALIATLPGCALP